jgi:hypothetical protein
VVGASRRVCIVTFQHARLPTRGLHQHALCLSPATVPLDAIGIRNGAIFKPGSSRSYGNTTKFRAQDHRAFFFFFFNRSPSGSRINEKKRAKTSSPAKIVPLKPPKEIHNDPIPPCAMETRPLDRLKA